MALYVQKYGGTSVGSVERIQQVAEKVKGFREISLGKSDGTRHCVGRNDQET